MAEIKNEPKELKEQKRDTLKLLNHWVNFRELLISNDTSAISLQSCRTVYCPLYNVENNYYYEAKAVPLFLFLNAPYREDYLKKFSKKILIAKPEFYYNDDVPDEMLKKLKLIDTAVQSYSVEYLTRDTFNNYVISRTHTIKFIVSKQDIKFAGLTVYENGSKYLYTKLNEDSLFFPLKTIKQSQEEEEKSLDTVTNKWLTGDLISFQEPNLYRSTIDKTDKAYRFTWLRSFDLPVVIRIEKRQKRFVLTCKELLDYNGRKANEFKVNITKKISMPQWITFEYLLKKMNFEQVQTDISDSTECMDGAIWILESKSENNYHCIYRHCSTEKDFEKACLYLLKLSGLKIKKKDIY